ncbi:CBS domain-containing protein [Priestia endophytica]|uniref:CBS domain-containing protein n=1 Tax=Priestia endophytica TaxID=135735 RepID=UPI00227DE770|nr:CBS domain-containing protein [Priestia endophytica]MCY8230856.1 CBS domain-containing protein [Priestia endophytica]
METVSDIMSHHTDCCTTQDNIYEVAVKMKELNVGAIPILDGNNLVGLITDRDLAIRAIAEKRPNSSQVTDVMSPNLVTVTPNDSLEKAVSLMAEHQVRRLPVVDSNKLAGIVSLGDIALNQYSNEKAGLALVEISKELNF